MWYTRRIITGVIQKVSETLADLYDNDIIDYDTFDYGMPE